MCGKGRGRHSGPPPRVSGGPARGAGGWGVGGNWDLQEGLEVFACCCQEHRPGSLTFTVPGEGWGRPPWGLSMLWKERLPWSHWERCPGERGLSGSGRLEKLWKHTQLLGEGCRGKQGLLLALQPLNNLWRHRIFLQTEEHCWGRVAGALRSSAPPQLTLVFVMSAGEGHHVVFLAPSPSFLPQSKFVLLFDLNTYPWLWTRNEGASESEERAMWGGDRDQDNAAF